MRMTVARPFTAAVLALACAAAVTVGAAGQSSSRQLRDRASDLVYNLDHDAAIDILRQAVAQDPNDSVNHRALASAVWLQILFKRGAVTVDHYLGSFTRSSVELRNPPADLDAEFKREVAKAIELAEKKVATSPKDPQAQFDLGAAVGLQATYIASVEGKLMAGFKAARRSYDTQEHVLELDPKRLDAGLIVGTYRYIVSTLSFPMRMVAYVAGFGGDKAKGLRMIEETAGAGGENRTEAQFALVLLYNREKRFDDALRVLADLRRRYPRNRLVLLEAGATAARGNKPQEAEALLSDGLAMLEKDNRPRIPGEEALWHYKRGAARVMLRKQADAQADLRAALRPDAAAWVQGRAHLELARLATQQGDGAAASREASQAVTICEQGNDPICIAEAKKIR
jgi:tetratricopeptide (TPR) repeat protein